MAVAKIGFALVGKILSKIFPPSGADLIKMLKNDLPHFTSQPWRKVIFELLSDVKLAWFQPVFALSISFYGMYMHRLITLVRVKEKRHPCTSRIVGISPYLYHKDSKQSASAATKACDLRMSASYSIIYR